MANLKKFLKQIHSWPEEIRSLAAGFLFLIALVVMYEAWNLNLNRELDDNFVREPVALVIEKEEKTKDAGHAVSPIEGLGESLLSITSVLPEIKIDKKSVLQSLGNNFSRGLSSIATLIYN